MCQKAHISLFEQRYAHNKVMASRPVQDTFKKYLDTYTFSKKYLDTDTFNILSEKSI